MSLELSKHLDIHTVDSNALSDGVSTSTQLSCTEPLDGCAWRNQPGSGQVDWFIASFKSPEDPNVRSAFTRFTGRSDTPSEDHCLKLV